LANTLSVTKKTFSSRIDNARLNFTLDTSEAFQVEKIPTRFRKDCPKKKKKRTDNDINGNSIVRMDRREAS
jgi:hypothetical protein